MTVRKIISLLLCLLSCSLSAQIETQLLMDSVIEDYQETAENEQAISDLEAMAEMLEQCYEQKIDINHADEMVLRHVLKLSDTQIYDLKSYLSLYGEMVMPYELNAIASLRKEINRILPQIEFLSSQVPLKEFLKKGFTKGMHQILIKYQQEVEPRQGYQNGDYLGKPFYMSLKYQYNYRQKVRFGLSAEKDAGELFFKGAQKAGFDFYGMHLFIKDMKWLKALALGDYRLFLGQGLIIGYSAFSGSSADSRYLGASLKPYTSTTEYGFQRGLALQFQTNHMTFHLFYSHALLDGALEGEDSLCSVSTWTTSGLHRTISENAKKYSFNMNSVGGHAQWACARIKLSLQGIYNHLSQPYYFDPKPYQKYYFQGQQSFNIGAAYQILGHRLIFYGETAVNEKGGTATLNGWIYRGIPLIEMSFITTYFSPHYYALTATGVLNNAHISNEIGCYAMMVFQLPKSQMLYGSITAQFHPEPTYQLNAPSHQYRLKIRYTLPLRSHLLELNYHWKLKVVAGESSQKTAKLELESQHYGSGSFKLRLHETLTFKTIVAVSVLSGRPFSETGIYCGENMQIFIPKIKLSIGLNCALYYAQNEANRFYIYEPDLLYTFSIPMYDGRGFRWSILGSYQYRFFKIQFKISQNLTPDKMCRGSGNDEVKAYTKTEFKVQLIFKIASS